MIMCYNVVKLNRAVDDLIYSLVECAVKLHGCFHDINEVNMF